MFVRKRFLFVLLSAVAVLCAFSACGNALPDNTGNPVSVRITVLDFDGTVLYQEEPKSEKSSLYELFAELDGLVVQTTAHFVTAVWTVGADGYTETARIENAADWSKFISIFHDIDDPLLKDVDRKYDIRYQDKDYYLSGLGVAQIPLIEGAGYVIKLVATV